jgi:SAM-dependent methyltransferase
MRMRVGTAVLLVALGLGATLRSQSQANPWDGVYAKVAGGSFDHNAFLARMVEGRPAGRALDIGIGEGRNAFFLASRGWNVTGFDASAAGIALARAEATKRGATLTAVVADVDGFDYGRDQWDLVAGLYMHEMITRNAAKIAASLKPGGLLVVEGMQFGAMGKGVGGGAYGYRANELLRAFDGLRVVFYEEAMAPPYWMPTSPAVPIVRFAATR